MAWSGARRRIWNGASAIPIGTTRPACAAGCSVDKSAALLGLRNRRAYAVNPYPDRRFGVRACLLRGDPDIPGGQRRSTGASKVWKLGMGPGHSPHLGRSAVANSADWRDRRTRYHLWDSNRWIAGQPRSDHQRPSRLRADVHLRTTLGAPLHWAPATAQD